MRNAVLVPAAIVAVLAGAVASAVYAQSSGTTAETARMAAVADQFPADSNWTRAADHMSYNGYFCSPDAGCAGLQRRWEPLPDLSAVELQAIIDAAGWDMQLEGDCIRTPEMSGEKHLCRAEGLVDGLEATLFLVSSSTTTAHPDLVLNLH